MHGESQYYNFKTGCVHVLHYSLQTCGKRFARVHHLKRHVSGVHNRERPKPASSKVIIKDAINYESDTVLFTTDEMGDPVLVKEFDYLSENENSFVVQSSKDAENASTSSQQPPQYAATSLLQLSQTKNEPSEADTLLVQPNTVYEFDGQEGSFVLVTDDDEQKLVPISQLSNYISAQGP